jgi:hypothetical protein
MFVAASNLYLAVCLGGFPKILRQVATLLPPISGEMVGTVHSTQWIILDRPTLW